MPTHNKLVKYVRCRSLGRSAPLTKVVECPVLEIDMTATGRERKFALRGSSH